MYTIGPINYGPPEYYIFEDFRPDLSKKTLMLLFGTGSLSVLVKRRAEKRWALAPVRA